jgi:hypothetical protein
MMALADRDSMRVERADFDDLVTLVTQAPPWEKDRLAGIRILLRAIAEDKPDAPEQILARWTWRLARATRKVQDRRASAEYPEAKRLLGALANSRGHRHEENAAKLVKTAKELPMEVAAALLASAEGYTPRANHLIDAAREQLGTIQDVAAALAENLPAPKQNGSRSRRRRRRKKKGQVDAQAQTAVETQGAETADAAEPSEAAQGEPETEDGAAADGGDAPPKPKRRRRRKKPASATATTAAAAPADGPSTNGDAPAAEADAAAD